MFIRLISILSVVAIASGCAPLQRMGNSQVYEYTGRPGNSNFTSARITVLEASDVCWLMLNGEITLDAVRAFRLANADMASRKCKERWVFLQSPGGLIIPAIEIGKMVRAGNIYTTLEKGLGNCSSACGLIFISGVKRELPVPLLEGRIGFHQPAMTRDGKKVCLPESSGASLTILAYAKSMLPGRSAEVFHGMVMGTECTGMKSYSYAELVSTGIATKIGGPNVF